MQSVENCSYIWQLYYRLYLCISQTAFLLTHNRQCNASASHHPRPAAMSSGRSSLVSISCVGGEMHGSPTYARAAVSSLSYSITALFTPHRVIVQYRANGRFAGIDLPHFRGGFTFFWGGISPPKYGLNKTLVQIQHSSHIGECFPFHWWISTTSSIK